MFLNLYSNNFFRKPIFTGIAFIFLFFHSKAQIKEGYKADIELQTIGTTNGVVPFWMRSNQFGAIPLSGLSLGATGHLSKDYNELTPNEEIYGKDRILDWGFGLEARANGGKNSNFQLIEAYGKAKFSIFQLKIGRTKDVMGLNGDTALSSGNFSISGNALGIPKVEIAIPEYWRVPIFDGLFSIKGNFNHGWLGKTKILDSIGSLEPDTAVYYIQNNRPKTYLHQKSLYVKMGREDWKLHLYGGFSHQVTWGNEQAAYGSNFKLSPAETFFYVATGKAYGTLGVPSSKIGNQLGSIDIGADYSFDNFNVLIYRQFLYDVGALSKLANVADGLTGITFTNKNESNGFTWSKILFEFFYSTDQAGYPWSTPTKSGDEDYYNNFYYVEGWSYKKLGLGTPLITSKNDVKSGQATFRNDYFVNNRVVAFHLGVSGGKGVWDYTAKMTYSRNYGTFATSKYGNSTGTIRHPQYTNLFKPVSQVSLFLNANKTLSENYRVGFAYAGDIGSLLNDSHGLYLSLKRSF